MATGNIKTGFRKSLITKSLQQRFSVSDSRLLGSAKIQSKYLLICLTQETDHVLNRLATSI